MILDALLGRLMSSRKFIEIKLGKCATNWHSEVSMLEHFNGLLRAKDYLSTEEYHTDCHLVLSIDKAKQSALASCYLSDCEVTKFEDVEQCELVLAVLLKDRDVDYRLLLKEEVVAEMDEYLVARDLLRSLNGTEGKYVLWIRGARGQDRDLFPTGTLDVVIGLRTKRTGP